VPRSNSKNAVASAPACSTGIEGGAIAEVLRLLTVGWNPEVARNSGWNAGGCGLGQSAFSDGLRPAWHGAGQERTAGGRSIMLKRRRSGQLFYRLESIFFADLVVHRPMARKDHLRPSKRAAWVTSFVDWAPKMHRDTTSAVELCKQAACISDIYGQPSPSSQRSIFGTSTGQAHRRTHWRCWCTTHWRLSQKILEESV
jgi:hypothetical protein